MNHNIDNTRKHYKINTLIVNDKKFKKAGKLITLIDVTDLEIEPGKVKVNSKKTKQEESFYIDPLKEEIEQNEFMEVLG